MLHKNKSNTLWIIMYTFLLFFLGIIVLLCVTGPLNNLIPWQMAILTVIGSAFFCILSYAWHICPTTYRIKFDRLYPFLLLCFGIALYIISCVGRNSPSSSNDYHNIWDAACNISRNQAITNESYLKMYANNIKPMLFLSVFFRIAEFLHISDAFYFILIFTVLQVVFAIHSVIFLICDKKEDYIKYRIPTLLLFVLTLPIWGYVQTFYTDSMSFGISIIALALLKLSFTTSKRMPKTIFIMTSAVLIAFGMSIKITILIPLIAAFIVMLFFCRKKSNWNTIVICIISSLFFYSGISFWTNTYEIAQIAQETSEPIISWIALGLKGNGSYHDNLAYIDAVSALPTKAAKTEYIKSYIWDNREYFLNLDHLIQKMRYNFASGTFGLKEFAFQWEIPENIIWQLFSPWGSYYWRTSQISTCYWFSIYVIYFLGTTLTLYRLLKKEEIPTIKRIADLTLFGNIIFLMIWEANNRQLYNQVPILILGALLNAHQIVTFLNSLRGQKLLSRFSK